VVSATQEDTLTVIAWKQPQITAFTVARVDASGKPLRDGVRMKATIKATANSITVDAAEENSIEFQVKYREKGAETWTQAKAVSIAGISVDGGYVLKDANDADIDDFDDMKGYDFVLALSDIYAASTATAQIATSEIIADFNTTDNGVALGGESTGEKFESYKPAHFYDGVPQFDYSTSAVDTGIKWTDGKTIYRKVLTFTSLGNSATKDVSLGVSEISTCVRLAGMAYSTGGSGNWDVLPLASPGSTYNIALYMVSPGSNPYIRMQSGSAAAKSGGHIVVDYTLPDDET